MTVFNQTVVHVALPVPLRHHFDYLIPDDHKAGPSLIGRRVKVPFGKNKQKVGFIVGESNTSGLDRNKLKEVISIIDEAPLFNRDHLKLLHWVSDYYLAPIGELIFTTLPAALRQGKKPELKHENLWQITPAGSSADPSLVKRAKKQRAILDYLKQHGAPCSKTMLDEKFTGWRDPLGALMTRGLVEKVSALNSPDQHPTGQIKIELNPDQQVVFDQIQAGLNDHSRFLLDGITGSGKTEIYIKVIQQIVEQNRQALVLVPEIGLTPQFISRFRQRIDAEIVLLHSGLTDNERIQAWIKAREGIAQIIIGTRSAVWTPMKNPGLYVIDEEHDLSYKQQDGIRYSARDVAILRASRDNASIILGSATPSLESLQNAEKNKLAHITLKKRAEDAQTPEFRIIDLRGKPVHGALSEELINAIRSILDNNKQVLLFQNRRGYSPVLMCHGCGWIHECDRCDMPLTYHKLMNRLLCHHCGRIATPGMSCVQCDDSDIIPVGHGTERLYETLREFFPEARILRIDRDTTRRKGAMEDYNEQILSGAVDILVGTQMLAKGHHYPDVTLVGIIDADMGLYSNDFRAGEKMAQLITQVSGRAGRASHPGKVMIQTHYPEHPLIRTLIENDYSHFADLQLSERKTVRLPPYTYQVMLRAEAYDREQPMDFLTQAGKSLGRYTEQLELYGPFPSPIEKRRGRYRFQLLIQAPQRNRLQGSLKEWVNHLDKIITSKKVRWSIDVDPMDML